MLTHAGTSTLAQPRCWHAFHALTCGPFKHTMFKDLTHTRPPGLKEARYCIDAHPRCETWQYRGLGTRNNRTNWGQICFHCYLSFLLGLFKTEHALFQSTFRLAQTSMEMSVFFAKLLPLCNCNYSPLSMYLCILSMCGPLRLPGLKENLCKVCCWKELSCVRFVQSSCRTLLHRVRLRARVGDQCTELFS